MQVTPSEGSVLCVFFQLDSKLTFSGLSVADVWDLLLFEKFCAKLTGRKWCFCYSAFMKSLDVKPNIPFISVSGNQFGASHVFNHLPLTPERSCFSHVEFAIKRCL